MIRRRLDLAHADAAVRHACRLTCGTRVAIVTKVHDSAIKRRTVPLATTDDAINRSDGGSKPASICWITCRRRVCRFYECIPGSQALVLRQRSQPSVFATGFIILCGCVGTTDVDQSLYKCGGANRKARVYAARRTSGNRIRFGGVRASARCEVQRAEWRACGRRRRRRVYDAVADKVSLAADAGGVVVAPNNAPFVNCNDALAVVVAPDDVANVLNAEAVGSFAL